MKRDLKIKIPRQYEFSEPSYNYFIKSKMTRSDFIRTENLINKVYLNAYLINLITT